MLVGAKAYGTPYWTWHGAQLGSLGVEWGGSVLEFLKAGAGLTKDILTIRPPAGTAITTTPTSTQVYRTAEYGVGPLQFLPPISGVNTGTLILIGGLVVVGLMFATRRR